MRPTGIIFLTFQIVVFAIAVTALVLASLHHVDNTEADLYVDDLFVKQIHGQSPVVFADDIEMRSNNIFDVQNQSVDTLNVISEAAVGTSSTPDVNSILDLVSLTKGMLVPRMTTANRTAMPNKEGMVVFDTDVKTLYFNDGTQWDDVSSGSGGMQTAYNNGPDLTATSATSLVWTGDATITSPLLTLDNTLNTAPTLALQPASGQAALSFPETIPDRIGRIEGEDATVTNSAGVSVEVTAGAADGSGAGGTVSLTAGAATTGVAGNVNITSGSKGTGGGGEINITSGAGTSSGVDGGLITIQGGTAASTGTAIGGQIALIAGLGGAAGGNGGPVLIRGGEQQFDGFNSGNVVIQSQSLQGGAGVSGVVSLSTGTGGPGSGVSNEVILTTGVGGATGGATGRIALGTGNVLTGSHTAGGIELYSGNSGGVNPGGLVHLRGGVGGGTTGTGGEIRLQGGVGGATGGIGGQVLVEAGDGGAGNGNGGGVIIQSGLPNGTGNGGDVEIKCQLGTVNGQLILNVGNVRYAWPLGAGAVNDRLTITALGDPIQLGWAP